MKKMEMKYTIKQIKPFIEKFIKIDKIDFIGRGEDSEAFCVNNDFVFKFPKHKNANDCLKNEILLLKQLQNTFEIEIPNVIYEGEFTIDYNNFTFFASKKLKGKNMTKTNFLSLEPDKQEKVAKTIAKFLKTLHSINQQKTGKDIVLLHGDFSLNHVLFQNGEISGILDFADSHIGNYEKDFEYLLDDEDRKNLVKNLGRKH
jgi:aminoglycoside phosphotransferase (APT) family kinase protein